MSDPTSRGDEDFGQGGPNIPGAAGARADEQNPKNENSAREIRDRVIVATAITRQEPLVTEDKIIIEL